MRGVLQSSVVFNTRPGPGRSARTHRQGAVLHQSTHTDKNVWILVMKSRPPSHTRHPSHIRIATVQPQRTPNSVPPYVLICKEQNTRDVPLQENNQRWADGKQPRQSVATSSALPACPKVFNSSYTTAACPRQHSFYLLKDWTAYFLSLYHYI